MTIPTPFTGGFPFNQDPFRSRVESQIDASKNYYAVAFKPGFPLQASELNEMQEIFYVQNTLNSGVVPSWTANSSVPWNGCTPYSSTLVTGVTSAARGITAFAQVGWYLVKHATTNGGLGTWVYNDTVSPIISGFTGATATQGYYGMVVKPVTISCTTNSTAGVTQDRTLQDSSNLNIINGPCGADRLKLNIVKFGSTAASGEYVVPIFNATKTGFTAFVIYINGTSIAGVSV
jgi:hypothetical protein